MQEENAKHSAKFPILNVQFSIPLRTMIIEEASNQTIWDDFLGKQRHRPFLQSWTMGEVYRDCGEEPVRLIAKEGDVIVGICQAIFVPARRGKHLAIPYGPVIAESADETVVTSALLDALKNIAQSKGCSFLRVSPFAILQPSPRLRPAGNSPFSMLNSIPSPLHLLAEHIWYLPLQEPDLWSAMHNEKTSKRENEKTILAAMRKTTRNLIRRAEKEGVTVEASKDPMNDLSHFLALHDETRKRHKFTPYTNAFFKAQVAHFAPRNECTVYLAWYQGQVIASSIHMHAFGETSYHHGASAHEHRNIPASYLLQWTAIRDALKRGDLVYNFWGIAPGNITDEGFKISEPKHPFAGVTLFKTGFGGKLFNLMHCQDIPISKRYYLTRGFEMARKWKRGF